MPNDNKPDGWKDYDEFAVGIDTNRLPGTDALVRRPLEVRLENGRQFTVMFKSAQAVELNENGVTTQEWGEAIEVADDTFFIDLTLSLAPKEAESLIVNTQSNRVLSIRCRIREEGEAPGEPRVAQVWVPGQFSGEVSGMVPHETRDLIGLRAFYDYSPNHVCEHIYLSSTRYGWQNLVGVQRGHGDTDMATTFKFDEGQYVFGFREFIIPVASVFFYGWHNMRSTGKFLGLAGDGQIQNNAAGAHIHKASMTYYAPGQEPV